MLESLKFFPQSFRKYIKKIQEMLVLIYSCVNFSYLSNKNYITF